MLLGKLAESVARWVEPIVLWSPAGVVYDTISAILIAKEEQDFLRHFWYELRARRGIIPYERRSGGSRRSRTSHLAVQTG